MHCCISIAIACSAVCIRPPLLLSRAIVHDVWAGLPVHRDRMMRTGKFSLRKIARLEEGFSIVAPRSCDDAVVVPVSPEARAM